MADAAWKAFEREAAQLFGASRHWANSGKRLDFESASYVGQCKLTKNLSLEQLTQLAEEVELAAAPTRAGVVVVKVRRGRGRPSPPLVVCTANVWRLLNGPA